MAGAVLLAGIIKGLAWRYFDYVGAKDYTVIAMIDGLDLFYILKNIIGPILFAIGNLLMIINIIKSIKMNKT